MTKDFTFSIARGLALIAAVIGFSDAPNTIASFFGSIGMPFFFFCSGAFFKTEYITSPTVFVVKRLKRLYLPFIAWASAILCFHNVFHWMGLIGGDYHNWTFFFQSLWNILTNMSGYDAATCGFFWFFRTLLVVNILYWAIFVLLNKISFLQKHEVTIYAIPLTAFIALTWQTLGGFTMNGFIMGGNIELLGLIFFSFGVIYRKYEHLITRHWALGLSSLALLILLNSLGVSAVISQSISFVNSMALILTATLGFIMFTNIAQLLHTHLRRISKPFGFWGNHSIYILTLGILCFKFASMMKVGFYQLPWNRIADGMTVNYEHGDGFWIFYSIFGLILPIMFRQFYFLCRRRNILLIIAQWFVDTKNGFTNMIKASMPLSNEDDDDSDEDNDNNDSDEDIDDDNEDSYEEEDDDGADNDNEVNETGKTEY